MNKTPADIPTPSQLRLAREKIRPIEELGRIADAARRAGRTVVLAHGVFDLLHMGHVRHLEAARSKGDVVMVTITADAFVNKGPGRPVFNENLRAEMLASLEYVDWVGINHALTAEPVLNAVRPSVYVKGSDYRDASDDITGKIVAERELVEAHGGHIFFTDDITFSSSTLINRYLNIYEPSLQEYLDTIRKDGTLERLMDLIERVRDYRVLFVGDAIIDEYQYVVPMAKAGKENMIATLFQEQEAFAGGVFAAANHAASFCRNVDVLTCLGGSDSFEDLIRVSLKNNVGLSFVTNEIAPTTRKCRFVDTGYNMRKLFEVYFMHDAPIMGELAERLNRMLLERIDAYDAVVVTDFGHGLLTRSTIDLLAKRSRFLAVNTQTNSGNLGFNLINRYPRADYVCLDSPEARLATHDKHSDIADIVAEQMPRLIDCPRVIVTQGKHGCMAYERGAGGVHKVPALTNTIVDTVGAGDAFFAVTAPLVAAGATMPEAAFLGNVAGAMKVGIVGHRSSVEKVAFLKFLTALLK